MYPIKFIHVADLHLGKQLYGIPGREKDYFQAFDWILNKAINENVDFVLICGDLIDSEQKIDAAILGNVISSIQTFQTDCKEKLDRVIPILCIEGNHETPFFNEHSWLKLLADLELIVLL